MGFFAIQLIDAPLINNEIDTKFRLLDRKSKEELSAKYEKSGPLKVKGKIEGQVLIYHEHYVNTVDIGDCFLPN
jgi:hypothetical protein